MDHSPFAYQARAAVAPVWGGSRKTTNVAAAIPTLAEVRKRLAMRRGRANPWLTPVIVESPEGVPELLGPEVYREA